MSLRRRSEWWTANDRYPLAQTDFLSGINPLQKLYGVHYPRCVLAGNARFLAHPGPRSQENGLIPAGEKLLQVAHGAIRLYLNAKLPDIINLVIEHFLRQAVFRYPVAQQPASHGHGFKYGHRVSFPDQVIGTG